MKYRVTYLSGSVPVQIDVDARSSDDAGSKAAKEGHVNELDVTNIIELKDKEKRKKNE